MVTAVGGGATKAMNELPQDGTLPGCGGLAPPRPPWIPWPTLTQFKNPVLVIDQDAELRINIFVRCRDEIEELTGSRRHSWITTEVTRIIFMFGDCQHHVQGTSGTRLYHPRPAASASTT